jgi:hypothetical protein
MAATTGKDIFARDITVGTYVYVRCLVTAVNGAGPVYAGAGDTVNLTVETPGNVGERAGVSFLVSPVQCRHTGSKEQA